MGIKVSVVVPVHNPGDAADGCICSVMEQSMPPEEYEVIFADDGSDDGIEKRLDAIAETHANVRVLHLKHIGSPMRGRNAALEVATGEYVYFLDQGDRLERTALERMYERAKQTGADVLVGPLASGNAPPAAVFSKDREHADILGDRLLSALTPHKLYRRAFLAAEGIAFPGAGGSLAEQLFVLRAYLRASAVTVMSGEVCCRLGARPEPSGSPHAHVTELRKLLDVIDESVPRGRRRDHLYAHWFRTAVLRRLGGAEFVASSTDRSVTFTTLRELVAQRFPERLDHYLPVHLRVRAAMLRAGRLDQLVALSQALRDTHLKADVKDVVWRDGALVMSLTGEIMWGEGNPTRFLPHGEDRLLWTSPLSLGDLRLPPEVADVTAAVSRARFQVYARHEGTGVVHQLPVSCSVVRVRHGDYVRVQVTGTATLDATSAAHGRSLPPGLWEIHMRMNGGLCQARARVTGPPVDCDGTLADHARRLVVPWWSDRGELGVCVEPQSFPESIVLVSPGTTVTRQRDHVFVVVPVPYVPPSGGPPAELVLRQAPGGTREVSVPALVEPGVPGRAAGRLIARIPMKRLPRQGFLAPGAWMPFLRMDDRELGLRFGVEMSRGGRVEIRRAAAPAVPVRRYPRLRRFALRIPGARNVVRVTRTVQQRYMPS
ncbi:glycosyltransferase family 2 protein [Planomonospora sp. ID67723]|uniref:glycosyltransferase family 2 protein n=1 Tax=Planomonospora sp. ID67723 TaxID=2738134 RepID=UPI0018C4504D|nr:glycosyltransferase family 2 protein [Planomonospora sp. ID67723]MBG0826217.1 glycosyltransferase family 2 protein [Planomonospora sp. ID67723]